jgi:hypothetical protein
MKTILLILIVSFGAASGLRAQLTLRAGDVQMFYYKLGPPPPGNPCTSASMGTPNSASVVLKLANEILLRDVSFRAEILTNTGVVASSVWNGSNSPFSLSAVGYFYPGTASVRLTGLTGEVVITSAALPWTLTGQNVFTRQFESCPMDGVPFVPNLHLTIRPVTPGQVQLRWTTNASDFRLIASDSVPKNAWIEVTNARNIMADYFETILDVPGSRRYFQLQKPSERGLNEQR